MVEVLLKAEIKKYRQTLSSAQRAASYKRKFRLKYPHKAELQLRQTISAYFHVTTKKVIAFVQSRYPDVKDRADGFETEFMLFMQQLERELNIEMVGGSVNMSPFVDRILAFVLQFKEEEVAEYMKSLTGRPFYGTTEWWETTKRSWFDILNRSMTKNIEDYMSSVRETVYNAVRESKTLEQVIVDIMKVNTALDEKKAAFLARDMMGKLNGEIERQLQMSVGIDGYMWQTMNDERVRGKPGGVYESAIPSHWAMESKVCKWSDVSVVSLDYGRTWVPRSANMPYKHPGEDWLCRCSGAPFSLSLLREIDREIAKEREMLRERESA